MFIDAQLTVTPGTLRRHHRTIPRQFTTAMQHHQQHQHHHHHQHHQHQHQHGQQHHQQPPSAANAAGPNSADLPAATEGTAVIATVGGSSGGGGGSTNSSGRRQAHKSTGKSGGGGASTSATTAAAGAAAAAATVAAKGAAAAKASVCQCPVQHVPMSYMGVKHFGNGPVHASPPAGELGMPPAMTTKVISSRPRSGPSHRPHHRAASPPLPLGGGGGGGGSGGGSVSQPGTLRRPPKSAGRISTISKQVTNELQSAAGSAAMAHAVHSAPATPRISLPAHLPAAPDGPQPPSADHQQHHHHHSNHHQMGRHQASPRSTSGSRGGHPHGTGTTDGHPVLPPKLHRNRSASHQPVATATTTPSASASVASAWVRATDSTAANGNGKSQPPLQLAVGLPHTKSLPRRGAEKLRSFAPVSVSAAALAELTGHGRSPNGRSATTSAGKHQPQSFYAQGFGGRQSGAGKHHHTLPGGGGGGAKISVISDSVSKVPSIVHIPSPVGGVKPTPLSGPPTIVQQPIAAVAPTTVVVASVSAADVGFQPPASPQQQTQQQQQQQQQKQPQHQQHDSTGRIESLPHDIDANRSANRNNNYYANTAIGAASVSGAVCGAGAGGLASTYAGAATASLPVCTTYTNCSNPKEHFLPNDTSIDDEYLRECENCKSTHGSRYYLNEPIGEQAPQETMTLQRKMEERPDEDQTYYRASSTLPTNTKQKQAASIKSREPWFSTIPGSSSSDEEEQRD